METAGDPEMFATSNRLNFATSHKTVTAGHHQNLKSHRDK